MDVDNYNYVSDVARRRQHDIEQVQKEILQQHKYLESQINALRTNMKTYCGTPTCNEVTRMNNNNYNNTYDLTPYRKPFNNTYNSNVYVPPAIVPAVPLYQFENHNPYNYKQFNTNYYKRPSNYIRK
ncbi:hypothetical protein [Mocis latipes granulovirus]|uniref:Uncharacterized protein n=1 Tax=Mocis latipes granulovirus TaxID=2072024 RepID=A0A162GVY8_9BBAC|nr:hypothetical protein [Mocis latipes granulovirus]AKR17450.1 hypothetical protein [Mocis latipes granulovirus]